MNMTGDDKYAEQKFSIEVNRKQFLTIERALDCMSRIICGQLDGDFLQICNSAYKKKHDENLSGTPKASIVKGAVMSLKKLCWDLDAGANWGVGYSKESDMLYEIYTSMRHARYLSMTPEDQEMMKYTVMASPPSIHYSEEPFVKITEIKPKNKKSKKTLK